MEKSEFPSRPTLIYAKGTLSEARILELYPHRLHNVRLRPPIKQSDLLKDVELCQPRQIVIIDGFFHQDLSVWIKEIAWALSYPGVERVVGSSSMGAVRAADLWRCGMIGIGKIFEWFRSGELYDDADVAVLYARRGNDFRATTVPIATLKSWCQLHEFDPPAELALLECARSIYYADRTIEVLEKAIVQKLGTKFWAPLVPYLNHDQKALDAELCLMSLEQLPKSEPTAFRATELFLAQYERDRALKVEGVLIAGQHIDAHIALHDPDWRVKFSDAKNRYLALLLAELLELEPSEEEIKRELAELSATERAVSPQEHEAMRDRLNLSWPALMALCRDNAAVRKLHHALEATRMHRRLTSIVLDYLRSNGSYAYWVAEAARDQRAINKAGGDAAIHIRPDTNAIVTLAAHCEQEGLDFPICEWEAYLSESGLHSNVELLVALERSALARANR
jgi:hypothetical protein